MTLMAGRDLPVRRRLRPDRFRGETNRAQAHQLPGRERRVTSVSEVVGMEGDAIVTEVFAYRQTGTDSTGRATGQFVATGVPEGRRPVDGTGRPRFRPTCFTNGSSADTGERPARAVRW